MQIIVLKYIGIIRKNEENKVTVDNTPIEDILNEVNNKFNGEIIQLVIEINNKQ